VEKHEQDCCFALDLELIALCLLVMLMRVEFRVSHKVLMLPRLAKLGCVLSMSVTHICSQSEDKP
jgi:hypothetical protein